MVLLSFVRTDLDTPVQVATLGHPFGKKDIFYTNYAFFVAAAVVQLICTLLVAPT